MSEIVDEVLPGRPASPVVAEGYAAAVLAMPDQHWPPICKPVYPNDSDVHHRRRDRR
jgi:hypothetical protein